MGNLDELDVINPQSPNVGGFIQELDARAAQKANAPISTTVNDVLVSIGAGVPKTVAGFNDALSMTLNSPYALAHKLFGTSPDPFGAVATSDQISSTLRGIGDQVLSEGLSPEAIAQRQAISAPVQDPNANFLDVALAAIKNPLGSATHIAESAPSLGVGVGAGAMGAKLAGSMARPTIAATKAITKAEAAAKGAVLANALVNSGETFGELKDQPMLDRYSGASIPLGLSLLFGSGADPMVANRVLGEAVTPISNSLKDVAVNFGKGAAKGGAKEFASEAAEGGSQAVGESVGKREDIDWNKVSKQSMLEGIMGAGQGSVAGGLSNVQMADQQEAKVEDAVAKRINPVIDALNKLQTELQAQAQQTPVQVEGQPTNSTAETIKNPAEPIKEPQQIDVQPIEEQIADPDPEEVLDASSGRVDPTALQNRDRSQKGSVSDMHAIANKPDYARVSYSRDFGNGAPVVAYGSVPDAQKGKRDVAVGSSGRRIPVQYAVVEADSISTSNDSEGVVNPDYGNTDRVTAIAGNGRLAGLSLAYRQGTAGNYRQALTADKTHGIDPAVIQGMKNPVLVRIMPNNHVTKDIGDESNVQTTSALSAVEQARTDARRINLNGLKFNADGSVSASSLNEFVQAMPASERASMIDKDGRPTVQAVDRANNAIFAQAYNNDSITAMYAQATDPEAKLVINALARLAPKMAQLEGCGELDFRDALIDAVNAIVQGKRDGLSMREIASQQDFLADPDVTLFINLFANNPRSNKDAIEVLSDAADFAIEEANKPEQDMFGAVPRATRSDVMERARNRFDEIQEEKNAGKANEQEDVLQDADGSVRAEEDATGRDARADQVAFNARGSESTERSETEKVKLSIAGVTGARNLDSAEDTTKRMDDLAVAEEMEEAGTDARKILVSTGWQRGADGMWRYELMDGQLTIDSFPEKGEYRLSDIFDAPELYKAYPEMKDLTVEFDFEPNSDFGGFFDEDGFRIFVNADSISSATRNTESQITQNEKLLNGRVAKKNPEFAEQVKQYISKLKEQLKQLQANDISTLKGTIVHEVQHVIQQKEGFAKGGNPDGFPSMSELRDDLFAVKQELRYLNDALQAQEDMDLPDTATYETGRTFADIKRKKAKAENRLTSIQEQIENYEDPWASYQNLAGETEARNADARKDWSRQKRRQTLLEKTEDVQRTEQRIKFSRNPRTGKMDIKLSIAWHGSPHVFEVFLTDHIGTGEGFQAHGWGLYFAFDRETAERYRTGLSEAPNHTYDGKALDDDVRKIFDSLIVEAELRDPNFTQLTEADKQSAINHAEKARNTNEQYITPLTELRDKLRDTPNDWIDIIQSDEWRHLEMFNSEMDTLYINSRVGAYEAVTNALKSRKELSASIDRTLKNLRDFDVSKAHYDRPGRLFKVEIPDNDVMLDEQKRFADQPKDVQDGLRISYAYKALLKKHNVRVVSDSVKDKIIDLLRKIQRGEDTSQMIAKAEEDLAESEKASSLFDFDMSEMDIFDVFDKQAELESKYVDKLGVAGALGDRQEFLNLARGAESVYKEASEKLTRNNSVGFSLYNDLSISPKRASLLLERCGVKGIVYDGRSDGKCAVVFNDQAVKVLDFYSKNKPAGSPDIEKGNVSGTTAEDVARTLEADKDIGDAFTQLRDNGEVEVVQSVDDLPEEIRGQIDGSKKSWIHAYGDEEFTVDSPVSHVNEHWNKSGFVARLEGVDGVRDGNIYLTLGYAKKEHAGRDIVHAFDHARNNPNRTVEERSENDLVDDLIQQTIDDLRDQTVRVYEQKSGEVILDAGKRAYVLRWDASREGYVIVTRMPSSTKNTKAKLSSGLWQDRGDASLPLVHEAYTANAPSSSSPHQQGRSGSVRAESRSVEFNDSSFIDNGRGGVKIGKVVIKRSDNGDIQGLYDPRTGKVYLIADALTDETAKPVFLHELGVHSAYTKNPLKLETQMKMARNMVNNGVAQGNALAIRVKQRLFDAGEIDSMSDPIPMEAAEECMAYLVEEAASADPRSPFRKWFDKLVAAIKQWLNAHGLNVNLNEWDFVEIAKGNVTAIAREAGREKRLSYSKSGNAPRQSPSNQTPKASKILERDELGRFRLAPGRKLAEKVGQGLSAIDGLLSTAWKFQNAPKELRMQIREMKAKIESAGLTAKEMAEVMQSLSEAERKMISDVVEQELATGVNPPAYVMQIATQISSIMDQQADELVDLGMLSSESRDRFRGKYLPRFYMKSQDKEAQSFFARVFGAKQRLRGVAGGHMKGRGIFKEAPLDAVDQFLQLGWTVRDSKFEVVNGKVTPKQGAFASMPKGNEPVMLWRDFTKQEREQMGEIRDASYRFAVGYMETQRDLAIGRLFKAIASNPEWTSPTPRDGFEHVPVTEISETGGLLKYGALAGKYVDKVVLTHIAHIEEVQDGVKRAYRQAMAFWKEGKTAMNPVSHMNNTVGNFVSAHLAGVDMWDAKTYTKAVKSMMNADALYKEAREAGLFTGSFSREEFVETMPENLRHLFKSEEGKFKKFGDMFMNVLTWGLRKKMRHAYEMEDALFKMAIYTKCREAGMEPAESVDYAHRYIFVYDVLPEGARKIRDSVLPFFAWTYQAVPMIARSAVSYPWRFFAPAAILFAINTAYYMSAVGDDDDDWIERVKKARELEKAERGLLPDYMKGYTIFMTPKFLRLGVDESTGLPTYLNMSAMVPGGSFLDVENQMGGVPLPDLILPNHPVINAYAAFIANKDAFSGFDMTKKTDTAGEKTQKFAEYAWKLISPSIAVGNYHWTRMMDGIAAETGMTMPINRTGINRYGEAMTLDTAVKNLAGIKVRTVDFDNELDRKLRGYAYEARQIKSEMRSAGRLAQKGSLPKDAASEKIEAGKEKIGKIREKIDESRRNHAEIQRLTK